MKTYNVIIVDLSKAMLVDDVAEGVAITGFRMVVIEAPVGIKKIAEDIHNGELRISKYEHVAFMVGRQDVIQHRNFKSAYNKLIHALCTFGKSTSFTMAGPLPSFWDDQLVVRDLLQAGVTLKNRIGNLPGFIFCDASVWFAQRDGVVRKYMGPDGITAEGVRVVRHRMERAWAKHRAQKM